VNRAIRTVVPNASQTFGRNPQWRESRSADPERKSDLLYAGTKSENSFQFHSRVKPPTAEPKLLSPKLFERGIVTSERFLCWQTPRTREHVRWLMENYGHSLAEALGDLFWFGGL
jgi:hypothetical protein